MRKHFSEKLYIEMGKNDKLCLLTADLGYGIWDKIKLDYPDRFYDVGASEQLMIGIASGLAMNGKIPVVYSITPFLLYRPFEFIRNFVDHEKLHVKLIGGGRGKDYGNLGFSHWAEEDGFVVDCLKNILSYYPADIRELDEIIDSELTSKNPCYINLKK